MSKGTLTVLPDSIPELAALCSNTWWFDASNNLLPSVSGNWVAWMSDCRPLDYTQPDTTTWYKEIVAYNLSTKTPAFLTMQNADAWYPCVSGNYAVWEDYRNNPDGVPDQNGIMNDNSDIYIADLSSVNSTTHQPNVYPLCTAPGPQFAPRISGNYVVWEDWRDYDAVTNPASQIYYYDLTLDSNGQKDSKGNPIPNWKQPVSTRPNPDPAEHQLTNKYEVWPHCYPAISAISGNNVNVVWLEYFNGSLSGPANIGMANLNNPTLRTLLVADPPAYREQARIDGTQLVWEDWRSGGGDVYWMDINHTDAQAVIGGSIGYDGVPDIGGGRVAFSQYRTTVTPPPPAKAYDVYNVWAETMLPMVTVTP